LGLASDGVGLDLPAPWRRKTMRTHFACSIVAGMLCQPSLPVLAGEAEVLSGPRSGKVDGAPVLGIFWELLETPNLDPLTAPNWPGELLALDGKVVRLNGYVSLRPDAQDSVDLVLTPVHPSNHECGVPKPTSMVEVHLPGGPEEDLPGRPVEVCGRFVLARDPGSRPFRILVLEWGPCTDSAYASTSPRGDDFDGRDW